MGYRDFHALLHGLFHGYFLYYEIKVVVNIFYRTTAIFLFYVTLYGVVVLNLFIIVLCGFVYLCMCGGVYVWVLYCMDV